MSSSPRLASGAPARAAIEPFLYAEAVKVGTAAAGDPAGDPAPETDAHREAVARAAGRMEGQAQARTEYEPLLLAIRDNLGAALRDFARERMDYYQQVEGEVVRLALSIAGKILHREAQIDPLLLAGLVRVTLEQMAGETRVVVRVPPAQVAEYRGFFARHMTPDALPQVEEDADLAADQCRLQTSMGTTQMGIEVQLKEIEHGLLDLLARRPEVKR